MDDIKLLKMAAKAAGFGAKSGGTCWTESEYPRNSGKHGALWNYIGHMDTAELWNPLSDDGDALRLAMQLDMTLALDGRGIHAQKYGEQGASAPECSDEDKPAHVRRSIVRVAAYMGMKMP